MPKGLWEMMDTDTPPPHCHFDKSGAVKSHASNDRNADPPLVISTEAKRSSKISLSHGRQHSDRRSLGSAFQ